MMWSDLHALLTSREIVLQYLMVGKHEITLCVAQKDGPLSGPSLRKRSYAHYVFGEVAKCLTGQVSVTYIEGSILEQVIWSLLVTKIVLQIRTRQPVAVQRRRSFVAQPFRGSGGVSVASIFAEWRRKRRIFDLDFGDERGRIDRKEGIRLQKHQGSLHREGS